MKSHTFKLDKLTGVRGKYTEIKESALYEFSQKWSKHTNAQGK
jgi:hypothetical protein